MQSKYTFQTGMFMFHLDTFNIMQLGLCNDIGCIKLSEKPVSVHSRAETVAYKHWKNRHSWTIRSLFAVVTPFECVHTMFALAN